MARYRIQHAEQGIIGPVSVATVLQLARSGVLREDVLVARDGEPFNPIRAYEELSDAFPHLVEGPVPTYSGDIHTDSFFRVFQRFFSVKATGLLLVRNGTHRKEVFLEHGRPVFVASNLIRERFGDFLVSQGVIERDVLRQVVSQMQEDHRRLGDLLLERGILQAAELRNHLREQQLLRLVDLCTWEHAQYSYFEGERYSGEHQELDITIPELVLRAARVMPEKTVLLRLGHHLHQALRLLPNSTVEQCDGFFTPPEKRALRNVLTGRPVVELVTHSRSEDRRATLTIIYLLWELSAAEFLAKPTR